MHNFSFQNPVKIIFGKGQIASLADEIPSSARVMITFGGGSAEKNGVLPQVRSALKGRTFVEFGGIGANPAYEILMKAVVLGRQEKIDFLLAVGGGSVLDGTKFIAAAIPFKGDAWDIVANAAPFEEAVAIGSVLTLPATGSEMNGAAVISRLETKDKLAFIDPKVFPKFSILDPETTMTLPARQVGNGIVDTFVHVMEQYLTFPSDGPFQDRMAEGILSTLIEEGPKVAKSPKDYAVRANLMWSATMALNGIINVGLPQDWSSHIIGHELTALYGLDHGQTLAMVLPANMKVRKKSKFAKILQFGRRVLNVTEPNDDRAVDITIEKTASFFESLGVATKMSAYNLTCDVDAVLAQLERHDSLGIGEKGDMDKATIKKILELI